jgi:hypothetical protein
MLKADSSTLKSESDVQRRKAPPISPSVVAFEVIARTTRTMSEIDCEGKMLCSSLTR